MDKITTRHSVTVNSADVIRKNRIRRIKNGPMDACRGALERRSRDDRSRPEPPRDLRGQAAAHSVVSQPAANTPE